VLDAQGEMKAQRSLHDQTLDEANAWMTTSIEAITGTLESPLISRNYDLPAHPVSEGQAFALDVAAARELGCWYANAARILATFSASGQHTSMVRCWPHHFDMAVIENLDRDGDIESARSINIGMSPGDGTIAMPYFYVVPWPAPENPDLDELPSGHWITEGWLGAVLPASEVVAVTGAEAQANMIADFLGHAYEACRNFL